MRQSDNSTLPGDTPLDERKCDIFALGIALFLATFGTLPTFCTELKECARKADNILNPSSSNEYDSDDNTVEVSTCPDSDDNSSRPNEHNVQSTTSLPLFKGQTVKSAV
jgi:hypothetical protein